MTAPNSQIDKTRPTPYQQWILKEPYVLLVRKIKVHEKDG